MSSLIVVVGVTGAQGGSVARTFLQSGWRVRGITRNPSSEASQTLAAEGVDVVKGDADDVQSLVRAFEGASVIFSNVDFFTHLFQAMGDPSLLPAGRSALQWAYDREVSQGINIAQAAESPAVLKTLNRFVMSHLSHASKWSGGKYTTVYHFDSKSEILRLTKERCPEVAARLTTVQMGHYVSNWKALPKLVPNKQPDGTFVLTRPESPTLKVPFFVAHKDTGPFVKAAVQLPPGKDISAFTESLTLPEYAALWGRVNGVEARYKQVSEDEFWEGVPGTLRDEVNESFKYIEEFGITGGDPDVLKPADLEVKVPVSSVEEYFRGEDWSSLLNPQD